MKITRFFFSVVLGAIVAFGFNACKSHDHDHEHGAVTTLRLQLTNSTTASNVVSGQAKDLDGDGGNAPTIDTLRLQAGVTYNGTILLRNDNDNEDLTEEIREEADSHMFVFTSNTSRMVVSNLNKDSKNADFGIDYTLQATSGGSTTGTLRVVLRHYDTGNKTEEFDTDFDVTFPVVVSGNQLIVIPAVAVH
ncbi:MAG: hypothetical protein SFU91_07035 [Chloroherpetonaceae bacterium]|nr:hypothetical protein [Chloroherpetonaceae bacterium]